MNLSRSARRHLSWVSFGFLPLLLTSGWQVTNSQSLIDTSEVVLTDRQLSSTTNCYHHPRSLWPPMSEGWDKASWTQMLVSFKAPPTWNAHLFTQTYLKGFSPPPFIQHSPKKNKTVASIHSSIPSRQLHPPIYLFLRNPRRWGNVSGTEQMYVRVINKRCKEEFYSNILFALLVCVENPGKPRHGGRCRVGMSGMQVRECLNNSRPSDTLPR